jgi:hypothetical protein
MLVMLVTKLLGAGGAAEDRDDGPAEVAPDKHTKIIPRALLHQISGRAAMVTATGPALVSGHHVTLACCGSTAFRAPETSFVHFALKVVHKHLIKFLYVINT